MRHQVIEAIGLTALASALALVGTMARAAGEATPTPTPGRAGSQSLTDVAKDKHLKGDAGGTSSGSIVITNENLDDYASRGGLTEAKPGTQTKVGRGVHAGPGVKVVDPKTLQIEERMHYWQQKYRQQLERIATIKRQIETLDYEIPGLWRDFYAWDDPAYRDSVIKPKIDAALHRRDELEAQLRQEEPKLEQIKTDARKDGAEPGWFRAVKEPTPVPKKSTPEIVPH